MLPFKAILGILFILLVAAVAFLSWVSYDNKNDTLKKSQLVNRTYQVIQKADEISSLYKDTRLNVNMIIINRDTSWYKSYVGSMQALFEQLNALRSMTSDDPRQSPNIDLLDDRIHQFKNVSDSLIDLVITGRSPDVIQQVFLNTNEVRDDVSSKIKVIKDVERQLLSEREQANGESIAQFSLTFILLLIGIVVLLMATFLTVRYNFNKRLRIQDQLRRTNILFEKIFYDSPIAMVISELGSGRILNCNSVFARTMNFEIKELIGKTGAALGILDNEAQRAALMSDPEYTGKSIRREIYMKPRERDPLYVSVHTHIIPIYDCTCLLTAILDLSAHKKAEDDIKKALDTEIELNKLKSSFVTLASHEFRTPLTTILSSAFLLENYALGEHQEQVRKHLGRIKSSVKNLTSILDEFLSVTNIEEGNVQPNIEKTDIQACLENVCNNLQTFAKPGQAIHYSHTGDRNANTDPVLLANIVNNLVSNSIKYSGENSTIVVTSSVNSHIHLTVRDQGIGISAEDQKHLFERFFRASNAGTVQGTGLGLHIMRHYVQMLNGSIELQSEVGKGTQVDVTFNPLMLSNLKWSDESAR